MQNTTPAIIRWPKLSNQNGFTLIEMSIVIVIIGFIISGIFLGQSLIRQSQINSIMVDTQTYINAVTNFQQKYNALPGDMANATSYWGAMASCPPANGYSTTSALTCNGNGDGVIDYGTNEFFYIWQHLSNAQMIQGSYTGAPGSGGITNFKGGINAPASKVDGGVFAIYWTGIFQSDPAWFDGSYGNALYIGSVSAGGTPTNPLLSGSEALAFDSKFDDGLPAYGNIVTQKPIGYQCATTSVSSTAKYNVAASGLVCYFMIITGF